MIYCINAVGELKRGRMSIPHSVSCLVVHGLNVVAELKRLFVSGNRTGRCVVHVMNVVAELRARRTALRNV
jgi:hypothetical protein